MHEGALALARAESQGIRVDLDYVEKTKATLDQRIIRLEKKFQSTSFYRHWKHSRSGRAPNINSDAQLRAFIYGTKGLKPKKFTDKGTPSTDEDALLSLGIPELADLIKISKLRKIRDTYLDGFLREQVNGYIHPFFHLHFVKTYRSSSDKPNFQNIPKRDKEAKKIIRDALYPRPGHQLLEVDYGALEVRIAACYHKDPNMLKYIQTGHDMHADMTKQIFLFDEFDKSSPDQGYLRSAVKNGFVFPQFYGDYYKNCATALACDWGKLPHGRWKSGQGADVGEGKLSDHLIANGIKSLDTFTEHIRKIEKDFWGNRFKVYAEWKDKWWSSYQRNGYIDMLTGFRCTGLMGRNDAINYAVQGSAFHCLLWPFIQIDEIIRREGWDTRIIGQIHDALVFDVHPEELDRLIEVVKRVTTKDLPEAWKWINVPLEVEGDLYEVDASWASPSKTI